MTSAVLALRLSRRAIGAAAWNGETITFTDGRYLTSRRDRLLPAATRYLTRLVEQTQPRIMLLYAPTTGNGPTRAVRDLVHTIGVTHQITVRDLRRADLVGPFGVPPPRTRADLHAIVETLWPEARTLRPGLRPVILDAVALALGADTHLTLGDTVA